jgi:prolyl-tRNA editing enzyme YbaK/EbsC (Cys-tRNA(Pro) deacylase)
MSDILMSIDRVRGFLKRWNKDKDIIEHKVSTATVELAAAALGVIPARIAKSISLRQAQHTSYNEDEAIMVVTAGDMKLDNKKFRAHFGFKPRMLSAEEVIKHTGYAVGGVCPFLLPPGTKVYLDISMKRFETVFPACGSENSEIEITCDELEELSGSSGWVDVCSNNTAAATILPDIKL